MPIQFLISGETSRSKDVTPVSNADERREENGGANIEADSRDRNARVQLTTKWEKKYRKELPGRARRRIDWQEEPENEQVHEDEQFE